MVTYSLDYFPNEALMEIVAKLSLEAVLQLVKTNLTFNLICNDSYLIGKLKPIKFKEYCRLLDDSTETDKLFLKRPLVITTLAGIETLDHLALLHLKLNDADLQSHEELNRILLNRVKKPSYYMDMEAFIVFGPARGKSIE